MPGLLYMSLCLQEGGRGGAGRGRGVEVGCLGAPPSCFLSNPCEVKSRILDLELLMGTEAPVMMLSDVEFFFC